MSLLPAELGSWAPWLQGLAADVQVWLQPVLAQLQALIPAPGTNAAAASGEFAGFDGIHNRGRFERLLSSEWLYADLLPDEFLRRASSGQQLFLAPAFEQSAQRRALVVLFDAGPAQLGACRLVHLALWILLARRAREQRLLWRWGSWQQVGVLSERDDADALLELLESRSVQVLDANLQSQWASTLRDPRIAEFWTVGGSSDPKERICSKLPNRISVDEPLRVERRILRVAGPRGSAELELPEAEFAARLLRDPRARTRIATIDEARSPGQAQSSFALRQPPMFSADGHRIVLRMLDDSARLLVTPNSARDPLLPPVYKKAGPDTVAIGVGRRSLIRLDAHLGQLSLSKALGLGDDVAVTANLDQLLLAPGVRRWSPLWSAGTALLLLDQRRCLHAFELARFGPGISHRMLCGPLLGQRFDAFHRELVCALDKDGGVELQCWPEQRKAVRLPAAQRVLFGARERGEWYERDVFLQIAACEWLLQNGQSRTALQTLAGEQVIGVWNATLVCLSADRRRFHLRGKSEQNSVEIGQEVLAPSLSAHGVLAWYNRQQELVLYSLARRCELLRLRGAAL